MAHFEDLAELDYFGEEYSHILRAVGWLEPGYTYSKGDVDRGVFEKLCDLLQKPWSPVHFFGIQGCGFCRFTGGKPTQLQRKSGIVQIPGNSVLNLFVPANDVIYVAPELIAHYIDAHGYRPPYEFIEAVLLCPKMSSKEYFGAIRNCGWKFTKGEAI